MRVIRIINKDISAMTITSEFGMRLHPIDDELKFHTGIDISAAEGTPIYALADGVVVISKTNNGGPKIGLGHYLITEHPGILPDGFCVVYAHLKAIGQPVGTMVKAGDLLGYTGNSGKSKRPHLHLEIRAGKYNPKYFWTRDKDGKYTNAIDPKRFIDSLKPETIESITARVARMGVISDTTLWIAAQKGEVTLKPEQLQALFTKIAESAH